MSRYSVLAFAGENDEEIRRCIEFCRKEFDTVFFSLLHSFGGFDAVAWKKDFPITSKVVICSDVSTPAQLGSVIAADGVCLWVESLWGAKIGGALAEYGYFREPLHRLEMTKSPIFREAQLRSRIQTLILGGS